MAFSQLITCVRGDAVYSVRTHTDPMHVFPVGGGSCINFQPLKLNEALPAYDSQ